MPDIEQHNPILAIGLGRSISNKQAALLAQSQGTQPGRVLGIVSLNDEQHLGMLLL